MSPYDKVRQETLWLGPSSGPLDLFCGVSSSDLKTTENHNDVQLPVQLGSVSIITALASLGGSQHDNNANVV